MVGHAGGKTNLHRECLEPGDFFLREVPCLLQSHGRIVEPGTGHRCVGDVSGVEVEPVTCFNLAETGQQRGSQQGVQIGKRHAVWSQARLNDVERVSCKHVRCIQPRFGRAPAVDPLNENLGATE